MPANHSHIQVTVGLVPHPASASPNIPPPSHTATDSSLIPKSCAQHGSGTVHYVSSSSMLASLSPTPVENPQWSRQTRRVTTHAPPPISALPPKEYHSSAFFQLCAQIGVAFGSSSGGEIQDWRNRGLEELGPGMPTQRAEEITLAVRHGSETLTERC
ncbi:hypothetical protein M407DRAFT_33872 [Tulasnella calospora MUT 4182]|uniref:Uncharacterized protein n=1 Tax=Tulasnella calospora MUT 4182 TaxID=1051891 RepID=A0A0C3Q1L4_9AGAM|nr:hypothetical protein M407DRAFT_33872 [Tulasnella calospora MUT 4182]